MLFRESWACSRPFRAWALVFLSAPLLTMVGCKDSIEPSVPTTITIIGGASSFSALGQTARFSAQVLDQKGKAMAEAVITWSSSAPQVLGIDASGLATARGNGAAVVRAVSGSASGTRDVTIAQVPQAFSKVGGDAQAGRVGEALPVPIRVRALDSGGSPISGAQVALSVTRGGGFVVPTTVSTNAQGEAATEWTLGTKAGEMQEVTASIGGLSTVFRATATSGPPAEIQPVGGDAQTGYAMEPLPEPLQTLVTDQYGNSISGVLVAWISAAGGGALSPPTSTTDANGEALAGWTLGTAKGQNTATATVSGLAPATFTATALANAVISGTVAVTGLLSPPQNSTEGRKPVGSGTWRGSAPKTESVSGELLVIFQEAPLDAPQLGSSQFRNLAVALRVAETISATLGAVRVADRFTVAAISPAGLAAKLLVNESEAEEVATALRQDPRIKTVEPNYIIRRPFPPEGESAPPTTVASSETFYPLQAWHYEMIRLPQAWELTTGSQSVTVAVVDDGIRFDHPDLAGNLTADGYDFVDDVPIPNCSGGTVSLSGDGDGPDSDPTTPVVYLYDQTFDCVTGIKRYAGHGVHVSGTVGAVGTNGGSSGVNWDVLIRPVRVLGTPGIGSSWAIAQGILYAAGLPASNGTSTVQAPYPAQVINLSLGSDTYSETQANAVTAAANAGSLIVASAGNDGTLNPHYPAALAEAIAVSAVNPWWALSIFSTAGSWVDIAAPGGAGGGDFTADVFSTVWDFQDDDYDWDSWQGTSMAAPHVSGVAALLFAANPGITAAEVRQRLTEFALPIGSSTLYGAGLVDAFSSLTQGMGFERDLFVRLVDAADGREVSIIQADSDGSFQFSRLDDGNYLVFAGFDERGDQQIGVPGRAWGSFGDSAAPSVISVGGGGVYSADFNLGYPIETENNGSSALADYLALGGYMNGNLGVFTDRDWFAVQIPDAGLYTFTTTGWMGACGLAAQANTILDLYDANSSFLASHDDQAPASFQYCSMITASLSPGTYYVLVRGSTSVPFRASDQALGFYRVSVVRGG